MKLSSIFCYYKTNGLFWFRILGYGLSFKDITIRDLMFSERYGYSKFLLIERWIIHFLPKYKL